MVLFLVSLAALFAASIAGYLVVRSRAEAWPPPGMPALPAGLWASTMILLISSVTMHWALRSARSDRQMALQAGMVATVVLGLAFLVSQAANWSTLVAAHVTISLNLYAFTFYMLTGLHAAHVLGGIVLLGFVTAKAFRRRYSREDHAGVVYCTMYWHFLDAVWVVMFALIFLIP
jgi:cytochrome c oxidase subunit 3